ncbi:Flagellar motor rotation protein MotB [Salipiger abyssi]|uniref:Flagellar motor rotation protein MotB n=2 Tax=Salipiger abyssi TaxID=1250539 RepID=A0A1P8UXI5_9RHOB|nr:Flagellar motor rotation protein MotB [Salipiger abyssi]
MRAKLVVEADASAIVGETRRSAEGLDGMSAAADRAAVALQRTASPGTRENLDRIMQSSVRTAAGFGKVSGGARSAETAIGSLQTQTASMSTGLKAQAADLVATQRETAAWQGQLDQVRARFDPLFAAMRTYEKELRDIAAAERMGALSAETAAAARTRAKAGYDAFAAAQSRGGRRSMARGGVQTAAFQAQDIAVQLQMGTAASVVMAQQLPQLLGGFGMMGAVLGAVVAVGVPFVRMLLDSEDAAGTLDERLGKLDTSLQAIGDHLKILNDRDLGQIFGSMSGDIRAMTQDLLALERAAELKSLGSALDGILSERLEPSLWQRLNEAGRSTTLGGTFGTGGLAETREMEERLRVENYRELTGGRGPSYEEFQAQKEQLVQLSTAGDVEAVIREIRNLVNEFAAGGPVSEINTDMAAMLNELTKAALQTAQTEALYNGSAQEARLDKQMASVSDAYRQQAELAEAVTRHGENSAEVDAVRNRHARDALTLKLRELGIEEDSTREREALADLDRALAAEEALRAQERQRAITETLTGLSNELAITQSVIANGEQSVEVERLRTEQAREALRLRLEELGATEQQIAQGEELIEQSRRRARDAQIAKAEREAGQSLAEMQREAEINAAILQHGRDSLAVKTLQIEAARAEYAQSLKTLLVSQETKGALLAQWDAARGLASVDPFGSLAAAQAMLEAQQRSVAQMQLEQVLLGQSEETRRRVLALYEAELDIRQQGIDATGALAQQIRDGALAEADLAAEVAREADAWSDVQAAAESSIDRIVDAAMEADLPGLFEGIAEEIQGILTDLAIKNPLKNAFTGSDYATLADLGGLEGVWARLTGQVQEIDPTRAAADAAARSVATMQVTAANVIIGGSGISQFASTMGGVGGAAAGVNLPNSPVASQIWEFFKGKGLAPHQIAAIVGNAAGESGFDPLAVGDKGTSFGLFQHHASRADGLLAAVGGRAGLGNVQGQLDYVWKELLTSESGALQKLLATTNVGDATNVWMRQFERPADSSMVESWPVRLGAAEEALAKFGTTAAQATDGLGAFDLGLGNLGSILAGLGGGGAGNTGGGGIWTIVSGISGAMGLPGFDIGGPTGGSDPKRVAGLVHEQEFVFDAASTARIGVPNLEAIRRGVMPGYEVGGYASRAAAYPFLTAARESSSAVALPVAQPLSVVVNDYAGQGVEFEEQSDGRGGRQLLMTVGQQGAAAMAQPGNPMRKQLQMMGVKKGPVRR